MKISAVPTHDISWVWPLIANYMEDCAEHTMGRYTAADILDSLEGSQLWIAYDDQKIYGAVVTEIVEYPRKKVLSMNFCGGVQFDKWHTEIMSVLRSFAKDSGCDVLEATGRAGWARVFKDEGFRRVSDLFELPLEY